jgi:hypothetical protein
LISILNYPNGIVNAQVAAIAFAHTIIKCIFFGIVAVTAITIVSFEVFPLTAVPLVTIIREGESVVVAPTIDDIIYGKLEDEHTIGLVPTTTTVVAAAVFKQTINNMEYFQSSKNNNNNNNENNKLVHQGFRIKKAVLTMLDTEAKKKGISLSNLVNKILENHVTCDMYFEELGFIPVCKDFLRKVFGRIKEEEDVQNYLIDDSRELGLVAAKEYIPYFYSESNSDTLVQFLDKWFCKFQCHQHRVDNDNNNYNNQHHYFIVNHDINMNFSIALKAFLEALIEPIIKRPVKFDNLTQNAISFSFETLPNC